MAGQISQQSHFISRYNELLPQSIASSSLTDALDVVTLPPVVKYTAEIPWIAYGEQGQIQNL